MGRKMLTKTLLSVHSFKKTLRSNAARQPQ